jgi:hypothetical protein
LEILFLVTIKDIYDLFAATSNTFTNSVKRRLHGLKYLQAAEAAFACIAAPFQGVGFLRRY